MTWSRCVDAEAFLGRWRPILQQDESAHCLAWAAIQRSRAAPEGPPPFCFFTEEGSGHPGAYAIVFVDLMSVIGEYDEQEVLASTLVQLIELWLFRTSKSDHRVLLNYLEIFMASLHVSALQLLSEKPCSLRSIELHLHVIQAAIFFIETNLKAGNQSPLKLRESTFLTRTS